MMENPQPRVSEKAAKVLRDIYYLTSRDRSFPDLNTLKSFSSLSISGWQRTSLELKQLNLINCEGDSRVIIIPTLHTPGNLTERWKFSQGMIDVLRVVYSLHNEKSVFPDIRAVAVALDASFTSVKYRLKKLNELGAVNISAGNNFYVEPRLPEQTSDGRLSAFQADYLCLIFNVSQTLNHHPSLREIAVYSGKDTAELNSAFKYLESLDLVSSGRKGLKRYSINGIMLSPEMTPPAKEKPSEPAKSRAELRLTDKQYSVLSYIRHHILTYGYSPARRDLDEVAGGKRAGVIEQLIQEEVLFLDENTRVNRVRICRGLGMDDVPTELPFLTPMHYRIYDAVVDGIRHNLNNPTMPLEDITHKSAVGCFVKAAKIAERVQLTPCELQKHLVALREKGIFFGAHRNRYGLSAGHITVAKDINIQDLKDD